MCNPLLKCVRTISLAVVFLIKKWHRLHNHNKLLNLVAGQLWRFDLYLSVCHGERCKFIFIIAQVFTDIRICIIFLHFFLTLPFNIQISTHVIHAALKMASLKTKQWDCIETTFEESLVKFKQRLRTRSRPKTIIERFLSRVNFPARPSASTHKEKAKRWIFPFVTTDYPAVSNLKQTLMQQWSLIQNQPLLETIYLKPPIISYIRKR